MSKSAKIIVRTVALLILTVIAISLFGLLSVWAFSGLDPAQQEAIGAINTPWIGAQRDQPFVPSKQITAAGHGTPEDQRITTSVATHALAGPNAER